MKTVKLSSLGTMRNGMNYGKSSITSGCKIIGVADFGNRVFPDYDALAEIDPSIVSADDLLQNGDILFVRSNGNKNLVGRTLYICDVQEPICYSGFCIAFRPNSELIYPEYLFYVLRSPFCKKQYSYSQQTNITNLSQDILGSVDVPVPDLTTQYSLVNILSNIDKKIRLNSRICNEYEAMAKTIYDYWFTQFDFPDADGKPYRSSGGEMEWNEQLKRNIPKGWFPGTISGLMKVENTSVNPQKLGNVVMEHYSIPAFDVDRCPAYEEANTIESGKYAIDPECILTSKLNPHFKRLWDPYCDTENAICSTEFIVYRPRTAWIRPFCYAVLDSDAFYAHMSGKATASTGSRKRIQPDVSASFEFVIPDENTMRSFAELYGPIMEKRKALYKENHELTKLRDWLIPMLMNGQATVAEAEEEASKVIPFAPQTVEVRQAARNFGDKKIDDTADLVKAYMRRKNDQKS